MYGNIFRTIIFPVYETYIRGRQTLRFLHQMEEIQWQDTKTIKTLQWKKLHEMLTYAFQHVPYYQHVFKKARITPGDIRSLDDMVKIPLLTKKDIRENYDLLRADDCKNKKLFCAATGGSTGSPVRFCYDHYSYEYRIAGAARADRWAGWNFGEREFYVWGVPLVQQKNWITFKKKLHHSFLRRHMFNSFNLSEEKIKQCVREINLFRPRTIIGYATPLYVIAQYINKNNLKCFSPAGIISSAEPLYDFYRKEIEQAFHTKVFNRYGARECMLIAAECDKHEGLHINSDNLFVELVKDNVPVKSGEIGQVVITDLNNFAMPFIRYVNEDLGVLSDKQCSCGRGLPLLKSIEGRITGAIVSPSGRIIPGTFFPHFFKEFVWIREYQIIQDILSEITIKIVPNSVNDVIESEKVFLYDTIARFLGSDMKIILEIVDVIEKTASGKHLVTKSSLKLDSVFNF